MKHKRVHLVMDGGYFLACYVTLQGLEVIKGTYTTKGVGGRSMAYFRTYTTRQWASNEYHEEKSHAIYSPNMTALKRKLRRYIMKM